jgi:hypothetical protein
MNLYVYLKFFDNLIAPRTPEQRRTTSLFLGSLRTVIQLFCIWNSPLPAMIGAFVTAMNHFYIGHAGHAVDAAVHAIWRSLTLKQILILFSVGATLTIFDHYVSVPFLTQFYQIVSFCLAFKAGCQISYRNVQIEIAEYERIHSN